MSQPEPGPPAVREPVVIDLAVSRAPVVRAGGGVPVRALRGWVLGGAAAVVLAGAGLGYVARTASIGAPGPAASAGDSRTAASAGAPGRAASAGGPRAAASVGAPPGASAGASGPEAGAGVSGRAQAVPPDGAVPGAVRRFRGQPMASRVRRA